METYNAKLPPEMLAELRRLAALEDRTVASVVRIAIREYLDRREARSGDDHHA